MKIEFRDGLPFVTANVSYRGQQLQVQDVLLDTGLLGTVFSADVLLVIGVVYDAGDIIHRIRGVGGTEFVFSKSIDRLALGDLVLSNFEIEVGVMDYGFKIDGIVGMDFLTQVGAVIDLSTMEVYMSKTTKDEVSTTTTKLW